MNRVASVVKMHSRDKWSWFFTPWLVMLSSFIVNLFISLLVDEPIRTGGIASIFIYMFVAGIVTLAQTFPFALGLSVSRKDYYLGTAAMIIITSIGSAAVLLLLALIENWTGAWGSGLYFFNVPYLSDGPLINQFTIPLVILLFMHFWGMMIAATHKRIGKNGMFIISAILLFIFTILGFLARQLNWYSTIFDWMGKQTAVDYSLWMLPFIVIFAGVTYLLLRRSTV